MVLAAGSCCNSASFFYGRHHFAFDSPLLQMNNATWHGQAFKRDIQYFLIFSITKLRNVRVAPGRSSSSNTIYRIDDRPSSARQNKIADGCFAPPCPPVQQEEVDIQQLMRAYSAGKFKHLSFALFQTSERQHQFH